MVDWHTHKHIGNIFPAIRLAKIKRWKKTPMLASVWESMQHYITWMGVATGAILLENSLSVAFKLFAPQPLDSISFLGVYSTDTDTQMHENACMRMFIFTLFIIVKEIRQPKYSSIRHWLNYAVFIWCNIMPPLEKWVYLSFSPLPFTSLLFTAICKASSDSHFAFLDLFFLGDGLDPCLLCNVMSLRP